MGFSEKTKEILLLKKYFKELLHYSFPNFTLFILKQIFIDNFNILDNCRAEKDFFICYLLESATIFHSFRKFLSSSWAFLELQQPLLQIFQTFQLLLQNSQPPS